MDMDTFEPSEERKSCDEATLQYKIQLKELTFGTFVTDEAAVDICDTFLIVSFLHESKTTKLYLDVGSISKIRQRYEAGDNMINCVLRPKKIQEFAKQAPEGFIFSYSKNSHTFVLRFPNELDENVVAYLKNMLSSITPIGGSLELSDDSNESSSESTLKRPTTEINLVNDENSPPNCKKTRKNESTPHGFEVLKSVFDEDSSELDKFQPTEETAAKEKPSRPKRLTRRQAKQESLAGMETSDYYEGEDIPKQLLEKEPKVVKKRRTAAPKFPEFNDAETLMAYPLGTENVITMENYKCLDRPELIDDVILDFYIQYIYRELMSEEMRKRVHICPSSFYTFYSPQANFAGWKEEKTLNASEKRYLRVKDMQCLQDVNIFEKDFIVFPCHDHDHWFLAIVCYPRLNGGVTLKDGSPVEGLEMMIDRKNPEAGEPVKRSCVLTFDSVKSNPVRRSKAMSHIRRFLGSEYNAKYQSDFPFIENAVACHSCQCPQQSNATDCGLYLLEFVEQFFVKSPIQDFRFTIDVSDWFTQDVILQKREHIAQVIKSLILQQKGEVPALPPISFAQQDPDVQMMQDNNNDNSNGNNNNEEEFNNNNDFNAVDHNKVSGSVEVVQEMDPLVNEMEMSRSQETSDEHDEMKGSLAELHSKLQEQKESNEPETSSRLTQKDAHNDEAELEQTQVSIPAIPSSPGAVAVETEKLPFEERKIQRPEHRETFIQAQPQTEVIEIDSD